MEKNGIYAFCFLGEFKRKWYIFYMSVRRIGMAKIFFCYSDRSRFQWFCSFVRLGIFTRCHCLRTSSNKKVGLVSTGEMRTMVSISVICNGSKLRMFSQTEIQIIWLIPMIMSRHFRARSVPKKYLLPKFCETTTHSSALSSMKSQSLFPIHVHDNNHDIKRDRVFHFTTTSNL